MKQRTHSARHWLRKRTAALNVLANPTASTEQRHRARCRLNRAASVMDQLADVPLMKRGLESDKTSASLRALVSQAG